MRVKMLMKNCLNLKYFRMIKCMRTKGVSMIQKMNQIELTELKKY